MGGRSEQSWNTEADTASWRDDDWYTADSNSQTSVAAEEVQHALVGDLRLENLGCVKHIESSQRERLDLSRRTITFGIDTAACKTVVPTNDLQHVCIWSTKTPYLDVRAALQAETKCMIKERGFCAPQMRQESRWPSRAEKSIVDDP